MTCNVLQIKYESHFEDKFAFEKKTFVLSMHQSYAAEDDGNAVARSAWCRCIRRIPVVV